MKKKKISLVLGSGGARGIVHIGIIQWLEEHNYEIKSISGCSMGALVGGFYAAGRLQAYAKWLEDLAILDMFKLLDFKGRGGLISGEKLMGQLQKILGEHNIEDLHIQYTAVATDIDAQKEVWINKGPLLDAIRASISLPLFFTPYNYKNKRLVDGGVLNPVPIAPTFHDTTDLTISVNLGADPIEHNPLKYPKETKSLSKTFQEYLKTISFADSLTKNGMYVIANNSFDTMQSSIAKMKLAAYPSDIEIDIPVNLCGTFEFQKAKQLIEYGYNLCNSIEALQEKN